MNKLNLLVVWRKRRGAGVQTDDNSTLAGWEHPTVWCPTDRSTGFSEN
jgi:hypothetical protein